MRDLLSYIRFKLTIEQQKLDKSEKWTQEYNEFLNQIDELDSLLSNHDYDAKTLLKLIQGPLSDALTHVGQLALLSRMMDKPVQKISYYDANIEGEDIE